MPASAATTFILPLGGIIDRNITLCLACSSSLPPLKVSALHNDSSSIHITSCCQRPICPSCITANPRLARYNPCLACLGGVGVVASNSSLATPPVSGARSPLNANLDLNIDGAVRDEDTFVLGDDEDDYSDNDEILDSEGQDNETHLSRSVPPPPPYGLKADALPLDSRTGVLFLETEQLDDSDETPPSSHIKSDLRGNLTDKSSESSPSLAENSQKTGMAPYKYYINRNDTLQGISLRFGLDAHEICKLNNLPFHSIRTMPHLLHTRAFLLLPPSMKSHPLLKQCTEDDECKPDIVRKRAEKRLQMLTKEIDWRIAKAYVALAEDDHGHQEYEKGNEKGTIAGRNDAGISQARTLETRAIDSYLDDDEWEQAERRAGRGVFVPQFPNVRSKVE